MPMQDARDALALGLVFAGWVDFASIRFMLPWAFWFGIPVLRREHAAPSGLRPQPLDVSAQVCMRAVGPNRWVFRRAGGWFDPGTPLLVRGTVTFAHGQLVMTGRASLPLVVMVGLIALVGGGAFWVVACCGACVLAWVVDDSRFSSDCAVVARALSSDV